MNNNNKKLFKKFNFNFGILTHNNNILTKANSTEFIFFVSNNWLA